MRVYVEAGRCRRVTCAGAGRDVTRGFSLMTLISTACYNTQTLNLVVFIVCCVDRSGKTYTIIIPLEISVVDMSDDHPLMHKF